MMDSAKRDVDAPSTPSPDTAIVDVFDQDSLEENGAEDGLAAEVPGEGDPDSDSVVGAVDGNDDVPVSGAGGAGGDGEVGLGTGGSGAGGNLGLGGAVGAGGAGTVDGSPDTGDAASVGGSTSSGGAVGAGGVGTSGGSPGTGAAASAGGSTGSGGRVSAGGTTGQGGTTTISLVKLTGATFGTGPAYFSNPTATFDKAFDGDITTCDDDSNTSGGYTGIDLGARATSVVEIRYYPRSNWTNRMVGGRFQCSTTSQTSGYTDLYRITSEPPLAWSTVKISTSATCRYLRYLSPDNGLTNVAEIEFWGPAQY
jgi:hypothetical protein